MAVDRAADLIKARGRLMGIIEGTVYCAACGSAAGGSIPAAVRELRAVLVELESLPGAGEVDPLDQLANSAVTSLAEYRNRGAADR